MGEDIFQALKGYLCGIFGTDAQQKALFESSVAKKSEVEGIIVFHRNELGTRYSLLDDDGHYPEKIQAYSRIASISDYAYYIFPNTGKLTAPDGELAVLLDIFDIKGKILVIDANIGKEKVLSSFKGLKIAQYPVEEREGKSSILDFSKMEASPHLPQAATLIYIDRAFNVKGVGVVVLGFILSGEVSVHDKLRLLPGSGTTKYAEVKGIQVSDEDFENAGRGIRVGLSLKGVELADLSKTSWLDDGSLAVSNKFTMSFRQVPFYKGAVYDRDLHAQLPGEIFPAKISKGSHEGELMVTLQAQVPSWNEMKLCFLDLNAKNLRVVGSGTVLS